MAVQQITAQLVGFVAMALCIGCFQCKSKNMLLALQLAGNAVFILHYVLLGAYSGCASLILLVGSNLMLLFRIKGKSWAQVYFLHPDGARRERDMEKPVQPAALRRLGSVHPDQLDLRRQGYAAGQAAAGGAGLDRL